MLETLTAEEKIKRKGLELGFTHVGITTADDFPEYEADLLSRSDYAVWAEKDWTRHPKRLNLRRGCHPREFFPEARSIVCATWGYSSWQYPEEMLPYVARAYLSRSYVPLPDSEAGLREAAFKNYIGSFGIKLYEGPVQVPCRAACARAGIITYGKNNFAYTKEDGSFNILYVYVTDGVLRPDEPTERCDCPEGCRQCIDACPSGALEKPRTLHPAYCMMNLEQFPIGRLPKERWGLMGVHLHGCDICQEACPRNAAVLAKAVRKQPFLEVLKNEFDLEKVLFLDDEYYERVVRPIMYNYIRDPDIFRRNAAIAMGNSGERKYLPALEKASREASCGEVREAAAWAIERLEEADPSGS